MRQQLNPRSQLTRTARAVVVPSAWAFAPRPATAALFPLEICSPYATPSATPWEQAPATLLVEHNHGTPKLLSSSHDTHTYVF